jgi:hypothetical protein
MGQPAGARRHSRLALTCTFVMLRALGSETMGVAALLSWLVTAFAGLYLLAVWLIENDVDHGGTAPSRLPGPVILAHVLLVLGGLAIWVFYPLTDSATAGWAAVAILGVIAALGLTMLTRWIPVHRALVAAESGPQPLTAESALPAERAFPAPVVASHGLLAATTITLVLLTVLGVGGS